jgi:hypothetical protein
MSCCGNQRRQFQTTTPGHPPRGTGAQASSNAAPVRQFVISFEYVGQTALTAVGGATGKRYRFDRPGARVVVDPRDRPSLAVVPALRQV